MSCDRYTGAIVDHACGAEIATDAAAHLQACAECRRMFDEQRRWLQDLDQELHVALAIEPSARFVAEAMAGVDRSANRWRTVVWWSAPVAAAAAVLVLLTLGSLRFADRRPGDRHEPAALQTAAPARVGEGPSSTVAPSAPAQNPPRLTAARRSNGERMKGGDRMKGAREATGLPEVVVSDAQSRAIDRYMTLVRRGALHTSPLPNSNRTEVTAPTDLVIAPLSVDVLVVPNGEGGTGSGADRSELR